MKYYGVSNRNLTISTPGGREAVWRVIFLELGLWVRGLRKAVGVIKTSPSLSPY